MSLSPAILDAMVKAGCSAEQIAAAVKAGLAEDEARAEAKREQARERKRRQRSRNVTQCHADNEGQRVTDGGNEDAPLPLSPNDNNSNPHTPAPETQTPARVRGEDFPMPDFCEDPQLWRDFKANRKAKRLPNTPSAHAKLLRDIHKLADDEWPPGKLFAEIVARGWAAAHDPRPSKSPANDRQDTSTASTADRVRANLGRPHR